MSQTVIKVENLSKQYRLGTVGTGTLSHDLNRWWHKVRGKEDPYLKIGESNDRASKGESEYVWALKDINFEVKQGEVLGIIGKNGAGKSTLLKILSKVTGPTTGSIKAKGRIASLLEVGTGFHPELTGRENIYLNGTILGMTKREVDKKLDEIVDFAGVARYIDTPVKRYSSGMTVRLGFAVAAHLEPEILVVDEVLAVGDAEFQKKAIGKMQEVSREEGRTVLFVSHNMSSVKSICNSGIILERGMVSFIGSSKETVSVYLKRADGNMGRLLKDRSDRKGSGKFKFLDIRIKDENNRIVESAISGEAITFEIEYSVAKKLKASELILVVNIQDYNSNNILSFIGDEMESCLNSLEESGTVLLKLKNLSLRSECYKLRLIAFEGNTSMNNCLDYVENAAVLNVLQGDINKIGRMNRKGFSAILPAKFEN